MGEIIFESSNWDCKHQFCLFYLCKYFKSAVPQGSELGPNLFLFFLKDIVDNRMICSIRIHCLFSH